MTINILPKPRGPFRLDEISKETGCSILNKVRELSIYNITPIETAKQGELTFIENMKYLNRINNCKATAIIVPNSIINKLKTDSILLGSDNAYASYAKALQKFYPINNDKENLLILKKSNLLIIILFLMIKFLLKIMFR